VLQRVAACCSVLPRVTVCCSVLQHGRNMTCSYNTGQLAQDTGQTADRHRIHTMFDNLNWEHGPVASQPHVAVIGLNHLCVCVCAMTSS